MARPGLRTALCAAAALMTGAPSAHAQGVSAEAIAQGFVDAVEACVESRASGVAIAELPEPRRVDVIPGDDALRQHANARDGQPAWTTTHGAGVVAIVEYAPTQCNVTAYGPRVEPVMARVASALAAEFPALSAEPLERRRDALVQRFSLPAGEARISVLIDGGEPGMSGRRFRFPLLMAFVQRHGSAP